MLLSQKYLSPQNRQLLPFSKKSFYKFQWCACSSVPFYSNTAVKQGDKMYMDLINQEKICHISVIIRGNP